MNKMTNILPHHNLQKVKVARSITHLIVLLMIFVLPEVLFSWGHHTPKMVYIHPVAFVLIFYINYYFLIDRFLFSHRYKWAFFAINVAILVVYLLIILGFQDVLMCDIDHKPFPKPMPFPKDKGGMPPPHFPHDDDMALLGRKTMKMLGFFSRDCVMLILSVGLSIAMKLGEKWVKWDRMEKQMVAERKENELKNLKNQLNPHFLFNTLNNIYALIGISPEKAQFAVHELSQLLRYVLYENETKEVPLEKDLLFIKNYIELMRLRLNSLVTLSVNINEKDGVGKTIAPLMFISLVENAFKHGVSSKSKTFINISIKVMDNKIVCRVENSYFPKDEKDKSGSGIGISNLKRQLSIIYPDSHRYETNCEDGKYVSTLEINLTPTNNI